MPRIHILPVETARLIAAGEVIDKPASALRELLDNAIDSGATEITAEIRSGGIEMILVVDNGSGMDRSDLELSVLEHATSKIETADDLLTARTLGFRGEALASIASVARLEITSRTAESESGWTLRVEPGKDTSLNPSASNKGTRVTVRGIFDHFPARRQFLKRPLSEAQSCRQVFVEKAAAHPGISFTWISGGETQFFPVAKLESRIARLFPDIPQSLLNEFEWHNDSVVARIVYAEPSFHRKDRKHLQVFVNRRKVPEWGLAGVLEYAFSAYLPGGMKPCAFIFAEIDPALADFNIHPAKREVRIKNIESVKSELYAAFRQHLEKRLSSGPTDMSITRTEDLGFGLARPGNDYAGGAGSGFYPTSQYPGSKRDESEFWEKIAAAKSDAGSGWVEEIKTPEKFPSFHYLGRAFGPFLVFEKDSALFILDQHAAHERILYDQLSQAKGTGQALLVPYILECASDSVAERVRRSMSVLADMGFDMEETGTHFVVNSVPALLGERALQSLTESFAETGAGLFTGDAAKASIACKSAIKDGDILDDSAARDLIARSLALPFPRCPHGRPIWIRLDRAMLEKMVGRTIG